MERLGPAIRIVINIFNNNLAVLNEVLRWCNAVIIVGRVLDARITDFQILERDTDITGGKVQTDMPVFATVVHISVFVITINHE